MGCDRLCFVLPSAYGYFNSDIEAVGGGARQLSMISRELVNEYDVHFVVEDCGQPVQEVRDGVTLHRSYEPHPDRSGWKQPVQLVQLSRAMYRANADVYIYRGRPFLATLIYVLARALRAKWVYNLANDPNIKDQPADLSKPVRKLFEHALYNADAIITQTDAQAQALKAEYGIASTVVPSGYRPAESVPPHDEREYVLWVGRLDPNQKRPHLFLKLAERLPEVQFCLVGPEGQDDEYNEELQAKMANLTNLTYTGPVDPEEIHEYYRNAIALVNTSSHEGFPSTFLEAWRYETPVVSLDVPVTRYVDLDTYEGDANGDFDRLTDLVSRLASDQSFRADLSEPTAKYFQQNLTIEKVADRYGDVLQGVLEG